MKFLAYYIHRLSPADYQRTVYADSLNEATRQAEKWIKKGYMLLKMVQA